ncbi:DUF5590 domain-containing protein [Indiicoccus explosivorum]|uniref:cell wall elongation regulator TseB-like domain-containing protein n=1 Tax=Indiicoccus explosivorum TaxID=1917864 RepID=UPI000B43EC16|nr:DUF5590 domain-containing protein [Indiicoccus explosivorum]
MKWWFKFIGAFLVLLALIGAVFSAFQAAEPFRAEETAAEKAVLEAGLLENVEESMIYNGKNQTVTVIGTGPDGGKTAVFVSEEGEMTVFSLEGAIQAEQAAATALAEAENPELLHVRLGPGNGRPVWEVAFLDSGKLNYIYISAEDGSWRERILNL